MNKGGYTLVSLMLVNIAAASFTIIGLGKRLHAIGRKRVVLTDINIAGERMKDICVQVDLDTEIETDDETGEEITHYKALIRDVYGYVLSVTDDTISSEQSKDPLELQEEIEDLQDKTQKITRSETGTEVDGNLSADVIYGATSINSPSGAFDELEGGAITGDSIIENMTGYYFTAGSHEELTLTYAGAVKNGNKLTLAICGSVKPTSTPISILTLGSFSLPADVFNKLNGGFIGSAYLDVKPLYMADTLYTGVSKPVLIYIANISNRILSVNVYGTSDLVADTEYFLRYEVTFLLSDNLAA